MPSLPPSRWAASEPSSPQTCLLPTRVGREGGLHQPGVGGGRGCAEGRPWLHRGWVPPLPHTQAARMGNEAGRVLSFNLKEGFVVVRSTASAMLSYSGPFGDPMSPEQPSSIPSRSCGC